MRMPFPPNAAPLAGLALRCQPDSRLVRLSGEGEARAFEEIVRRYREPLVTFASAIVSADRAEDVVQEALARAHAALVASEPVEKLKPWLYTIVRNRALNDLRDEAAHEPLDEGFDGVVQPPEVVARREQLAALIARVKDLPPAQRKALVQRELEGRSHREIAVALGLSPGAVRGLIFRARTALRDGAGMLIPMPALRALLNAGPLEAEATGTAIGGAAAGLAAGGGGAGIAAKAGTTLAVAVLAVSGGVAIHNRGGDSRNDRGATAFASDGETGTGAGSQVSGGESGSPGASGRGSGSGSRAGGDSGHGSGNSDGTGEGSGPGDDDDRSDEDDSSEGSGGDEHEGSGGGEDEPEPDSDLEGTGGHEGPDGDLSGHEGSGSESSGSGSSGSGSSGPGGGGSGSSGSGSSGPG